MTDDPGAGRASGPTRRRDRSLGGAEQATAGLQFAVVLLVFVFAGNWLDERFGTAPWLTMAGVFIGAAGGIYSMYRKLMAAQEREERRRREGRE